MLAKIKKFNNAVCCLRYKETFSYRASGCLNAYNLYGKHFNNICLKMLILFEAEMSFVGIYLLWVLTELQNDCYTSYLLSHCLQ